MVKFSIPIEDPLWFDGICVYFASSQTRKTQVKFVANSELVSSHRIGSNQLDQSSIKDQWRVTNHWYLYCVVSKGQSKNSEPESWCSCPYCWWFRNPAINHLGCSFDSKTVCKKKSTVDQPQLVNTGFCGPSTCITSKIPITFLKALQDLGAHHLPLAASHLRGPSMALRRVDASTTPGS